MLELDKADKNSQRPETQDAMRKTTEREREAKDQIMEQTSTHAKEDDEKVRLSTGSQRSIFPQTRKLKTRAKTAVKKDKQPGIGTREPMKKTARVGTPGPMTERALPTAGEQRR